ncbi:hypothetical protein QPX96_01420 [Limosilactobacillus fermentum]|nr:hypothetical protein [Limosilactobacillus fermentum]
MVNNDDLDDRTRFMTILANLLGCQGIDEFRTMIPHMREQGGGRIIQIFSYGGQVAYPGNSSTTPPSSGSKALLNRLSKK